MSLLDQLTTVMTAYSAASGLSLARISTLVFNHGAKFELISRGADINTRSFERAMVWFSERWPADLDWPSDVPRPAVPPGGQHAAGPVAPAGPADANHAVGAEGAA